MEYKEEELEQSEQTEEEDGVEDETETGIETEVVVGALNVADVGVVVLVVAEDEHQSDVHSSLVVPMYCWYQLIRLTIEIVGVGLRQMVVQH